MNILHKLDELLSGHGQVFAGGSAGEGGEHKAGHRDEYETKTTAGAMNDEKCPTTRALHHNAGTI